MSLCERGQGPAGAGRLQAAEPPGTLPDLGQQVPGGAVVLGRVALDDRASGRGRGGGGRSGGGRVVGEGGRASGSSVAPAAAAGPVVVVDVAVAAAAAAAVAGVVVATAGGSWGSGVAPGGRSVDGLHRDLRPGLGRGVEDLGPGVVLGPQLHRGLHGDLGLLGEAVAAVGRRGAAVAGRWRAVGGGGRVVGGQRAVAAAVCTVQVGVRFDLDHAIGAGAAKGGRGDGGGGGKLEKK